VSDYVILYLFVLVALKKKKNKNKKNLKPKIAKFIFFSLMTFIMCL